MDKVSAGIRADATKVIRAYRGSFGGMGKTLSRRRVVEALRAVGATVVLDLWGGGLSARELIRAGLQVVCVENGSMKLTVGGRSVSAARKRRAFDLDAIEAGFTPFWGTAEEALTVFPDIDAAFLDYCGPWSRPARETIHAARHLKIVAVTLMPHHDIGTGATSIQERQLAYQLFLKMAWAKAPRWGYMSSSGCRILTDYDTAKRQRATVYLLGASVRLKPMDINERSQMREDIDVARRSYKKEWYHRPENRERVIAKAKAVKRRDGPFTRSCIECETVFITNNRAQTCSQECRAGRHYRKNRERLGRLAAVSGTTAEAVKD